MINFEHTGIKCPECGYTQNKVIYGQDVGSKRRRRRVCGNCGHRFNTVEVYVPDKKDDQKCETCHWFGPEDDPVCQAFECNGLECGECHYERKDKNE